MAWEHLSVNKPHLVYIILGGFTSLFMLCSSVIKERLYIGEATVATLCGIIFGPHAANLIDPGTWGNTDQITLEFSRIVLVVQCFAVGVELPKYYMEKHWRSVTFLLVPVMTFGWLVTSLFIWAVFHSQMNWLDSLVCAACVTATDPVLASSVVGKGKFAKRVPKHLRDLLSAESGCNDGMAFPFVYLGLYLTHYRPDGGKVAMEWFCVTILYECVFGALYGVMVGYGARRAIRYAHEKDIIDRESFLVFYFVLALFCAGSGSILGVDDLLVGFACGVGFSNDGWFLEKTEEAHVSNVIDLLINLAFFVYFGTIIPWSTYNSAVLGISPWKLVVIAILVLFFRRIPIMLALKPVIPDIKTWREALFAGHFGPIGVGAIFVAILARGELETHGESTTPLAVIPPPGFDHRNIIELIWPITSFLVITSILVHGSSIAVFTLGKHINTLTITMSYTQGNERSGDWMDRLPRIQSRSKSSMSMKRPGESEDDSLEEKLPDYPASVLPRGFLRRQRDDDTPRSSRPNSRPSSSSRRRRFESGMGPGGPISQSAISPQPRLDMPSPEKSESDTLAAGSDESPGSGEDEKSAAARGEAEGEVYREGDDTVIEDEQGNVLEVMKSKRGESEQQRKESIEREVRKLLKEEDVEHGVAKKEDVHPSEAIEEVEKEVKDISERKVGAWQGMKQMMPHLRGHKAAEREQRPSPGRESQHAEQAKGSEGGAGAGASQRRHGPARAFRFGRTIIVEDEDGEVIKKYDIPGPERDELDRAASHGGDTDKAKERVQRMGRYLGMRKGAIEQAQEGAGEGPSRPKMGVRQGSKHVNKGADDADDERIRFKIDGQDRRMSKIDFIKQIQQMDPKSRAEIVRDASLPEAVKKEARADAAEYTQERGRGQREGGKLAEARHVGKRGGETASIHRSAPDEDRAQGPEGLSLVDSDNQQIPFHSVSEELKQYSKGEQARQETAAERRRRVLAAQDDSDDDGTERVPPSSRKGKQVSPQREAAAPPPRLLKHQQRQKEEDDERQSETAAEKRRREGALGVSKQDSDSEEDGARTPPKNAVSAEGLSSSSSSWSRGIRFADASPRAAAAERGPRIRFRDEALKK